MNSKEVVGIECRCEEQIEHGRIDHGKGAKPNTLKRVLSTGLLRFLRMNRGSQEFSSVQEEIDHVDISVNNFYNRGKEIKTALLEAERKKAEALIEWQK